eukprot:SAG31_NODE_16308_length_714_cov_0.734959_1_plen_28_part_10
MSVIGLRNNAEALARLPDGASAAAPLQP